MLGKTDHKTYPLIEPSTLELLILDYLSPRALLAMTRLNRYFYRLEKLWKILLTKLSRYNILDSKQKTQDDIEFSREIDNADVPLRLKRPYQWAVQSILKIKRTERASRYLTFYKPYHCYSAMFLTTPILYEEEIQRETLQIFYAVFRAHPSPALASFNNPVLKDHLIPRGAATLFTIARQIKHVPLAHYILHDPVCKQHFLKSKLTNGHKHFYDYATSMFAQLIENKSDQLFSSSIS